VRLYIGHNKGLKASIPHNKGLSALSSRNDTSCEGTKSCGEGDRHSLWQQDNSCLKDMSIIKLIF
jgi:hypothetical protein